MASPLDRNRLDEEPSPYLEQHADNPVHWQPWDQRALDGAKERDLPIFCSIGYAACHWCHVMEEESFEDEAVAARLNEDFVPIKVDREERPDVDRIYQTICQLVTGNGGWPLSVFLTPDGRPFYVGTYFPPTARQGRPGFPDVLERLAEGWRTDREAIEERADRWQEAIRDEVEVTPQPPEDETEASTFEEVARSALRSFDRAFGGFGENGPKFPQPQRIELLLRAGQTVDDPEFAEAATATLDAMGHGGIYDHLGGGFHRYATDREWQVPHFEKMLYDNAELPRVYTEAYRATRQERYRDIVEGTLSFARRELRHPDGGFYSTLDAQSEGREGAFYVWTPDDVREAVEDQRLAELLCERFGITDGGNFEHGTTVLHHARSIDALADEYERTPEAISAALDRGRDALFEARAARPRPARDEKVLTAWNGLMISAYAEAGLTFDPSWLDEAWAALTFVREHLWDGDDGRLYRRFKDDDVAVPGYLDDYAYLARGALDSYQATGIFEWLAFAVELADTMVAEFHDPDQPTLYYTQQSGESLVSRPQDPTDQSTPSSLAVGLDVLAALDPFVPDRGFGEIAREVVGAYEGRIAGAPLQHVGLAIVADRIRTGHLEWTIVADTLPTEWRDAIGARSAPDRLANRRPPDQATLETWLDRLDIDEVPPIWADRTQRDGGPTAYICREFTCSPPRTDPAESAEWLDQLAST